jgi:uncharacterized protein (DUF1697 family)
MAPMPTYVAFLRAINLGKNRKVPMADLRTCLTDAGCEDVETHIQTGNVRLRTSLRSAAKVEAQLEGLLADRFGFEIPSIVFTPAQLAQVYDDAMSSTPPQGNAHGELRYVALFKQGEAPTGEQARAIAAWDEPGEAGLVIGRAVHIWIDKASQSARFFNAFKKPLDPGTNRNLTVVSALAAKWGGVTGRGRGTP